MKHSVRNPRPVTEDNFLNRCLILKAPRGAPLSGRAVERNGNSGLRQARELREFPESSSVGIGRKGREQLNSFRDMGV